MASEWGDVATWTSAGVAFASLMVATFGAFVANRSTSIASDQARYAKQQAEEANRQNRRELADKRATAICLAYELLPEVETLQTVFGFFQLFERQKANLTSGSPPSLTQKWQELPIAIPKSLQRSSFDLRHLGPAVALQALAYKAAADAFLQEIKRRDHAGLLPSQQHFHEIVPFAHRLGASGMAMFEGLKRLASAEAREEDLWPEASLVKCK